MPERAVIDREIVDFNGETMIQKQVIKDVDHLVFMTDEVKKTLLSIDTGQNFSEKTTRSMRKSIYEGMHERRGLEFEKTSIPRRLQ